jgi:hypothetical protein
VRKKVKCSDCGYLSGREPDTFIGEGYSEIYQNERKDPSNAWPRIEKIYCYRHLFDLKEETDTLFSEQTKKNAEVPYHTAVKSIIEKPRNCKYHVGYVPGYSPDQHLMIWESKEREHTARKWNLLYAAIGSGITIAGMLAMKYFWG